MHASWYVPLRFLYTAVGTPGTWNVSWPNKNYQVSIVVLLELVLVVLVAVTGASIGSSNAHPSKPIYLFAIIIQAGGESPRLNTISGTTMQCMYG